MSIPNSMIADDALTEKFQKWDLRKHTSEKSMWAGSRKPVNTAIDYVNEDGTRIDTILVRLSPYLDKIIDEVCVNATDHAVRQYASTNPVTRIFVAFDTKTGVITVTNDGAGIPVKYHQQHALWIPQLIAGEFLSGTNLAPDTGRITGGTNGLGLKLVGVGSEWMRLTTFDAETGFVYDQLFQDELKIKNEPVIVHATQRADITGVFPKGMTAIAFRPNYARLGIREYDATANYTARNTRGNDRADSDDEASDDESTTSSNSARVIAAKNTVTVTIATAAVLLRHVLRARTYELSAYIGKYGVNVAFVCDDVAEIVAIHDIAEYVALCAHGSPVLSCKLTSEISPFTWYLSAKFDANSTAFTSKILVNGVVLRGGEIAKWYADKISDKLATKAKKIAGKAVTITKQLLRNRLQIYMDTMIVSPDFSSQRKESLPIDEVLLESYALTDAYIKMIWEKMADYVSDIIITKSAEATQRVSLKKIDKYIPALWAGATRRKKRSQCGLFIVEGDSAQTMIASGIHGGFGLDSTVYGVFNIGGVPMNARKQIKMLTRAKTGETAIVLGKSLRANERLNSLAKVIGLSFGKPPNTNEMNYDFIIGACDEDEDGVGHIFALILNWFELFWPALIQNGFVRRMTTPIVRVVLPKSRAKRQALSFYTEREYHDWLVANTGDANARIPGAKIEYFKGLGAHNIEQRREIFRNFARKIRYYIYDEMAKQNFEIYFGKDTNTRKQKLTEPVAELDEIAENTTGSRALRCSNFLDSSVKSFQLSDIARKIPNVLDGLIPVRRKVVECARRTGLSKKMKVFQLGGRVADVMRYHHGGTSIEGAITHMMQRFYTANVFPLLISHGQEGSIREGGEDKAAARYLDCTLNKPLTDALYSARDDNLLKYVLEDGERVDPTNYVPCLPMSILEWYQIPGTGWKSSIVARQKEFVIENIKRLIANDKAELFAMPPTRDGFTGAWYADPQHATREIATGAWTYNAENNALIITELPPRMWTSRFVKKLQEHYEDVVITEFIDDKTSADNNRTHVVVPLRNGVMETIYARGAAQFDPVTEFFGLYDYYDSFLNFTDDSGRLIAFDSYESVLKYWFDARKMLYIARSTRENTLTKLRILVIENKLKFIANHKTYSLSNLEYAEQDAILTKNYYLRCDEHVINNPGTIPTELIENEALRGNDAGYDYLLTLSYRRMSEKHVTELQKELEKLRNYLNYLANYGEFPGAQMWREEISHVEKLFVTGIAKNEDEDIEFIDG